jgi:hypothetical protein
MVERKAGTKVANILGLARKLEEHGFYILCADLLAKHDFDQELGELAEKTKGSGGIGGVYANMVFLLRAGEADEMYEYLVKLSELGPWGTYLGGKELVNIATEVVDAAAWLSGETRDTFGVISECREGEMILYGMKLYLKLGMEAEAGECLEKLKSIDREMHSIGLGIFNRAKKGGKVTFMDIEMHKCRGTTETWVPGQGTYLARSSGGIPDAEGRWKGEFLSTGYAFIRIQKYTEECASEEGLMHLMEKMERERKGLADRAFESKGDMEAQEVAGRVYAIMMDPRLFACIKMLIGKGLLDKAEELAERGISAGKLRGEPNKEWMDMLRKIAREMEGKNHEMGRRIYEKINETGERPTLHLVI